jgi:3-methyladenine DNA glycosylase AlkC
VAEPLKDAYGPEVPRRIAAMVSTAHPSFDSRAFVRDCLAGYGALNLIARGWRIADALHAHLPRDFPRAVEILLRSLGPGRQSPEGNGMAPFLYMPHAFFVARYGLDHFEASMRAQYEITKRFTAEFSIRPFIERHREATLERLGEWARDPDPHVRRLVSEGTRPRLPWAPRLREFQRDPAPVLALLELLKDDPELYVRRSVANNLNDIGKDHPELLAQTARRWLEGADANRRWLVKHALRSAVKRGACFTSTCWASARVPRLSKCCGPRCGPGARVLETPSRSPSRSATRARARRAPWWTSASTS